MGRAKRGSDNQRNKNSGGNTMSGTVTRAIACASLMTCLALPASAQETIRLRGTIERVEGPVYVVKSRDGSELKLTVTDNPLFVPIAPRHHGRRQGRHVRRFGRDDAGRRHPEGS